MTCRFCEPLECGEWHDAAVSIHARLPFRYWAEELEENRNKAKALHRAHKKPDYRLNMAEMKPVAKRKELSPEQREKKARKARERRAAARMKGSMTPQEAGRKGGRASGVSRRNKAQQGVTV